MSRGIEGSLKIPRVWLLEAKVRSSPHLSPHATSNIVQANYALDDGDIFEAYELFLQAELYDAAHDLAVVELAPDAILRRDFELLQNLFAVFANHPVSGWHVRGKVSLFHSPERHEDVDPFTPSHP